jgi:hypothetical protein
MYCGQELLQGCRYFDAIAYMVQQQTATFNPWPYAALIRKSHKNTYYFDVYQIAINWLSLLSQQKNKRNLPEHGTA